MTNKLVLFAPLTAIIEFLGIFLDGLYWRPGGHQALSDVSLAHQPAPLIFTITLTVGAITYLPFAMALQKYWSKSLWLAIISGLALTTAGWIRYLYKNPFATNLHGFSILLAVLVNGLLIWQMRHHGPAMLMKTSRFFFGLISVATALTVIDLSLVHYYSAVPELLAFSLFQAWGIAAARVLWRDA